MALSSNVIAYILLGMGVLLVVSLGLLIHLELKVKRILRGKNAKDLEGSLMEVYKNADEARKFRSDMEAYLRQVEKRLRRAFQSAETIRFDAFKGAGGAGNQSFATVYANENGDGVIISSLSVRERVSLFAKPLQGWKSALELSPEEKEVLESVKAKIAL